MSKSKSEVSVKPQQASFDSESFDDRVQPQVDDGLAKANAEIAELKGMLSEVMRRMSAPVQAPAQNLVASAPIEQVNDYERRRSAFRESSLRAEQRSNDELARQASDLEQLAAGPNKYEMCLTGEPRMKRRVGGVSPAEARDKYEKFFHIRGISDGSKQVMITPLQEVA